MKKVIDKIPSFIFSNYFIAIILSIIIFFSVDFNFSKYNYEILDKLNKVKGYRNSYFVDLDLDGYFEEVLLYNNENTGNASLLVYKQSNNASCQLNFKSRLLNENFREFAFADLDNDSIKEIIFNTHKKDSLFLNIVYPNKSYYHKKIYIDKIEKCKFKHYSYHFNIEATDLDNDLSSEILLNVFGYFSVSPRKIYLYILKNDTLISTNTTGNNIRSELLLADINNDGFQEITGMSRAPSNIIDSNSVLFSDASSWLMIFNNQLEFLFEPLEENIEYSSLYTGVLNADTYKYILYWVSKDEKAENIVYVVNKKGEKIDSIFISNEMFPKFSGIINVEDEFVYLYNNYGEIWFIDKQFKIKKKVKIEEDKSYELNYSFYPCNIDEDSLKEFFIYNSDKEFFIAEEQFKTITNIEIPDINFPDKYSFKTLAKNHLGANILIQDSEKAIFIKYYKNKYYSFRFLILPLIYSITFFVLYMLTYFQRIQIKRKTERERELLELQLKTIKNQIEPHFLYNTMTSIGHLIISEDRYEAYNYLESLASLTRKSLEMSDSVAVSLKGELEFVENYIELQKLRFEEKFIFEIQIDPNVDLNTKLPKMLLQIHVENAIKHGLMHKKAGGILKIHISKDDNNLLCVIEDNGIGLQESKKYFGNNTGKGLEIAQQTIDLYKKIHKIEIKQEIIDLTGINSSKKGVKVAINILL